MTGKCTPAAETLDIICKWQKGWVAHLDSNMLPVDAALVHMPSAATRNCGSKPQLLQAPDLLCGGCMSGSAPYLQQPLDSPPADHVKRHLPQMLPCPECGTTCSSEAWPVCSIRGGYLLQPQQLPWRFRSPANQAPDAEMQVSIFVLPLRRMHSNEHQHIHACAHTAARAHTRPNPMMLLTCMQPCSSRIQTGTLTSVHSQQHLCMDKHWHSPPMHEVVDSGHGSGGVASTAHVRKLEASTCALHEDKDFPRRQQAVFAFIG